MRIDIPMPVLKAICIVYIGQTDEIYTQLAEYSDGFDGKYLGSCTHRFQQGETLCFQTVIHSKVPTISVIAHEAVHAANAILAGMGVLADHDNDELLAYIVQFICERVEETLTNKEIF